MLLTSCSYRSDSSLPKHLNFRYSFVSFEIDLLVLLTGFKLLKDIGGICKRSVVFHQLLLGYSPIVILFRGLAQSVEGWVAD